MTTTEETRARPGGAPPPEGRERPGALAGVAGTIRENPVPATLIGAGAGLALGAVLARARRPRAADRDGLRAYVGGVTRRFRSEVLDAYLAWLLMLQAHGGADTGEVFAAAARVDEREPESWVRAFTELADRLEGLAEVSLARGHRVSAREAYLRASASSRWGLFQVSPLKEPARFRTLAERTRARFRRAAELFEPPVEPIEVPFEGHRLPGYFQAADARREKGKTLLAIGGDEMGAEDLWLLLAPAARERGYHFLTVDLPGQGYTRFDGLTFRPDAEVPVAAVLDWALRRPEVDGDRLAAFGMGMGGYLAGRAATRERRLKALVANSLIFDVRRYSEKFPELQRFLRFERGPALGLLRRWRPEQIAPILAPVDAHKWVWGAESMAAWFKDSRRYAFDPRRIACPTLLLVGEEEYDRPAARALQEEALRKIAHPRKELIVGPRDLGAGGYALAPNLSLMARYAFDWLDEVLAEQTTR